MNGNLLELRCLVLQQMKDDTRVKMTKSNHKQQRTKEFDNFVGLYRFLRCGDIELRFLYCNILIFIHVRELSILSIINVII